MRFGGLTAVQDLDLRVEPGQVFALIGPNGAGKTTVFNVVSGIYEATGGTILVSPEQKAAAVNPATRPLRQPYTGWVLLACVLVGLLTALAGALTATGIDGLVQASIKRLMEPGRPFPYDRAAGAAWGYLRDDLALLKQRGGKWAVTTADGKKVLTTAATAEEARANKAVLD